MTKWTTFHGEMDHFSGRNGPLFQGEMDHFYLRTMENYTTFTSEIWRITPLLGEMWEYTTFRRNVGMHHF